MSFTKYRRFVNTSSGPQSVIIEIDWDRLTDHLGRKALFNNTGKTRTLRGAIVGRKGKKGELK